MRAHLWVFGFLFSMALLAGCGAEPPKAPPPPPELGNLATKVQPIDLDDVHKRLVVVSQKSGLPEPEVLEAEIAKANLVASVGDSPAGIEVSAAGVLCVVADTEMPERPASNIQPELDAHGLSAAAGDRIDAATAAVEVVCRADETDVKAVPPVAETVADALVEMLDGQLHDPQTGRWWPRDAWAKKRTANKRFDVSRSLRILSERGPDGRYWLGTRGMVAFGRPDLELFPVAADQVEQAKAKLPVLADVIIAEKTVGSGSRLEFGPAKVMLLDREVYAKTLPEGTAGVKQVIPPPTAGSVALVDPAARSGDLEAHARFVRRLSL